MTLKQDNLLELLYRSFDCPLDDKEQAILTAALRDSAALREEKRQIENQRRAISASAGEFSFKPFFAERVVNRLAATEKKEHYADIFFETLFALFKRVALIGAAACLIVIAYNLTKVETIKADDALYVSQVTYEEILELPLL